MLLLYDRILIKLPRTFIQFTLANYMLFVANERIEQIWPVIFLCYGFSNVFASEKMAGVSRHCGKRKRQFYFLLPGCRNHSQVTCGIHN